MSRQEIFSVNCGQFLEIILETLRAACAAPDALTGALALACDRMSTEDEDLLPREPVGAEYWNIECRMVKPGPPRRLRLAFRRKTLLNGAKSDMPVGAVIAEVDGNRLRFWADDGHTHGELYKENVSNQNVVPLFPKR